jgi:dimethylargininase
MKLVALTRPIPDSLPACELTHVERVDIDLAAARTQHAAYERALTELGCEVQHITAAHDYPDSVFVEDTALVLDEVAVITRPGAASRRGETTAVADALTPYRRLEWLREPATLDGGDVLRLGRTLCVGEGSRTNAAGIAQLAAIVEPFGYAVRALAVRECLHLKSAVTEVAPETLLINRAWIDAAAFPGYATIEVDPSEPFAANVLRLGASVLSASRHRRTNERIAAAGIPLRSIDGSELAKAEGGLTCCSLIFTTAR